MILRYSVMSTKRDGRAFGVSSDLRILRSMYLKSIVGISRISDTQTEKKEGYSSLCHIVYKSSQ
jgi:hypothetical protein